MDSPIDFGKFDDTATRSATLPANLYIDPAVWEQEKRQIFYKSWNYVGGISLLANPGDYVATRIADEGVVVIRNGAGELKAFFNVCSHRAHELLRGQGNVRAITCPYHAWTYDLDGALRPTKAVSRLEDFDAAEACLKSVRVEEFCGFVFVNLDPDARPLAEQIGAFGKELRDYCPEPEKLKFAFRLTYEMKANWKNVVDNFLECYHCPGAHPSLCGLIDIDNFDTHLGDLYVAQLTMGRRDNPAYSLPEGSDDQASLRYGGWWLWPNLAFNVFPGEPNMTMFHIVPTGPETTLEHIDFYLASEIPTPTEQEAIEFIDKVLQPEDIGIVESVQRGLHSRAYKQGRFVINNERVSASEIGVHYFQTLVRNALSAR